MRSLSHSIRLPLIVVAGVGVVSCGEDPSPFETAPVFSATQRVITPDTKLLSTTGANTNFGVSVATDGVRVVVGSWDKEVRVFARNGVTWTLEQTLTSSDPGFGGSVAIDGDTIAVGGSTAYTGGGPVEKVVVYRLQGSWTQEATLSPTAHPAGMLFGTSVSISGSWLAVGAPAEGDGSRAFLYQRSGSTWGAPIEVVPPVVGDAQAFGWAVAIDGNYLAVSDPMEVQSATVGAVHFFRRVVDQVNHEAKRTNPDDWQHWYGNSLAIRGEDALIGSPAAFSMSAPGRAYVHRRSGGSWNQVDELVPSASTNNDEFGSSVALDDTSAFALVGAPGLSADGAAFLFANDGSWSQSERIDGFGVVGDPRFGVSVSLGGALVVVGGPEDNEQGASSGAAWVFSNDGTAGAAGSGGTGGSAGAAGAGGTAGASGSAGSGGTAGASGTAGSGGSAGAGGTAGASGTAGSGGEAGTAGEAGSAGAAGTAGSGGTATAGGSGGSSGTGGASGVGGGAQAASTAGETSGFYACATSNNPSTGGPSQWLLLALGALIPWVRRRS